MESYLLQIAFFNPLPFNCGAGLQLFLARLAVYSPSRAEDKTEKIPLPNQG